MENINVVARLAPVFQEINQRIELHLKTDVPFVAEVCRHILLSGGKRLRPALFVLATHLCGGLEIREMEFSLAFEFLHAATLLHDDVVDNANIRRGKAAAHTVYGNPGVILVGDFLFAKALAISTMTGRLVFTDVMAETVARMTEGEVMQLLKSRDAGITEDEYIQVIHRKTGMLIESCCYLGAILADGQDWQTHGLRQFGRHIGLAFQIIDDTLDYQITSSEFGKPVGHDLDEGKITLPLIRALSQASSQDKTELIELIAQEHRTPDDFNRVRQLIDKYHGLEQAVERAAQEVADGRDALRDFPESQDKKDLLDLADYIITRRK
ncbi:MAG: polyprenyl synthetase family protein [Deltaproteobacteria bacterium]|nr:polyprenyl synthetase family protein [Deltaproteobacteria bacterium]